MSIIEYLIAKIMKTYIALLRGINVSGKNKILMADLTLLFQNLTFKDVKTYIQSGNVVFKTTKNQELLSALISTTITKVLNLTIPVIIVNVDELKHTIVNNPFLSKEVDTKKLYVVFLNKNPKEIKKLKDFDFGKDQYIISNKIIYLKYDIGAGKTKLTNKIIENKLQLIATTRNWRTTNKLLELTDIKF